MKPRVSKGHTIYSSMYFCSIPQDQPPDDLAEAKHWYVYLACGAGLTPEEAYNNWLKDCEWPVE